MEPFDLLIYLANFVSSVITLAKIHLEIYVRVLNYRSTLSLSVYDLPDEDFCFIHEKKGLFKVRTYIPTCPEESKRCRSLVNSGVLLQAGSDTYKFSSQGKKLLI